MSRTRIVGLLLLGGVLLGTAAPALASDGSTRVCLLATNDRENAGPPALCVFAPVE